MMWDFDVAKDVAIHQGDKLDIKFTSNSPNLYMVYTKHCVDSNPTEISTGFTWNGNIVTYTFPIIDWEKGLYRISITNTDPTGGLKETIYWMYLTVM